MIFEAREGFWATVNPPAYAPGSSPRNEIISIFFFPLLSLFSPSAEQSSASFGGLALASAHPNGGVIAGSVIGILFILGCIAIITGINLTVCFYIASKTRGKRHNQAPLSTTAENRPILLSSIEDEVDKPGDKPPVSSEKSSEESKTEAEKEKEREAMEEEGEQRHQPQEATFATPSAEEPGETEVDVKT